MATIHSCCYFPLKTGVTILAVLSILNSIYSIMYVWSFILQHGDMVLSTNRNVISSLTKSVIECVLSVLLLIGTRKEKAHLIFPHLSWNFFFIFNRIADFTGELSYLYASGIITRMGGFLFTHLIVIAIYSYCFLVIFTFYQKLFSEQIRREVHLPKEEIFVLDHPYLPFNDKV